MCGISGIINKNGSRVEPIEIQKINNLIAHRGPDDEGFYFEKNFALGHRRLAILDLSHEGHQPMHYLDKYIITYNGEIYNYLELKRELLQDGYSFKSQTDTEVILASYDKWGKACVNKFNGMWAFALYDRERQIIFCSRDRFGVKPFYYTELDNKFIFGSEIKQLLEFYPQRLAEQEILIDFLVTSFVEHTNKTFFKNIYKLKQSHNLIYDLKTNTFKIEKYYQINFTKNNYTLEETIQNYQREFVRAINYRLRSDVKVGTCLSGGLDSSAVATIAAQQYVLNSQEKFTAIHAKSLQKETDESVYAKLVADTANLDLHLIEPTVSDFKNSIEEVVYTQEEPFASPSIFMQYFVMKKAKEINCKVMLDGQGGDETLLGYEKYYPSAYLALYREKGWLSVLKAIRQSNQNNAQMTLIKILKYTIGSFSATLRKKVHKYQTNFLKPYPNQFLFLEELAQKYSNINQLQEYEIYHSNLPALLRYEDKNSMRHAIEARLPFLDYITLETALNSNLEYKIKEGWSKYLLRKILEQYLPQAVVWRKSKLRFNAPDNIWLQAIQEKMKEEIKNSNLLNHLAYMNKLLAKFEKLNNQLKWRLYNLAVWERVYQVKL